MSDRSHRERMKRRALLGGLGAGALGTLAGCLGGDGDGVPEGDDDTGDDGDDTGDDGDGGDTDDGENGGGDEYDFGGEELDVILNVGEISTVHREHIIPKMEEEYNLQINAEEAVTTEQLTQLQANPDDPPDVIIPDLIGVERANNEGWLASIEDHLDIVTNYEDIHEKFRHYDGTGVSWQVGEVCPLINTNLWDETPTTWEEAMTGGEQIALVPFSWSAGPYLLLMASAIATDGDFTSDDLDVDAGFEYLEENLQPNVTTSYSGVASAKQQIASDNFDTLLPFWSYMTFDMFQEEAPIETVRQPDPVGIAFAECVAVPEGTDMTEAAMLYVNECLSVEFQEEMSAQMGEGVTNVNATVDEQAEEYGAPTADEFDDLAYPDFRYIWENRDEWGQRWDQIFGE